MEGTPDQARPFHHRDNIECAQKERHHKEDRETSNQWMDPHHRRIVFKHPTRGGVVTTTGLSSQPSKLSSSVPALC